MGGCGRAGPASPSAVSLSTHNRLKGSGGPAYHDDRAPVAQSDRAPASGAGCTGSSPVGGARSPFPRSFLGLGGLRVNGREFVIRYLLDRLIEGNVVFPRDDRTDGCPRFARSG